MFDTIFWLLFLSSSLRHQNYFVFSGFLSDITSSYNEAFYFSGAAIALCTGLLSFVPVLTPMRSRDVKEMKMTSDELGKKRRPSFFEKYVQRYLSSSEPEPSEVEEYLFVVDKITAVWCS